MTQKAVRPEKYGARAILTPFGLRNRFEIDHKERHAARYVDQAIERGDMVEIPGTRFGEWEYRESVLAIPASVVAEALGDDPTPEIRARFLEAVAEAHRLGRTLMYDTPDAP